MTMRRFLGVAVASALILTGAACGNDSKGSDKTNSEQSSDKKDDSSEEAPTSTVSDSEFSSTMTQIRSEIEAAGSDECALSKAVQTTPPDPANSAQTREFVDTYVMLLRALTITLGADSDHGKALTKAADTLEKTAKDTNYKEDVFENKAISEAMTSSAVTAALSEFGAIASKCLGADGGAGTDGAGGAGTDGAIVQSSVPDAGN